MAAPAFYENGVLQQYGCYGNSHFMKMGYFSNMVAMATVTQFLLKITAT